METLSVTGIIKDYHCFCKQFWLQYKTLEKLLPKDQFDNIKLKLLKSKKIFLDQIPNLNIEQFNIEKELLDKEWTEKNEEAKQVGITTHEMIHNLFCTDLLSVKKDLGIDTSKYKLSPMEEFKNTVNGIFNEFRIELPLDEDYSLVGVADCIIKDGDHITIIDWKTDEKIPFKSNFDLGQKRTRRLKYPLCDLEDCAGIHYQIQLSMYARMLQLLNPELIIDKLLIVQMDGLKKKKEFEVEYIKNTIDKLLKWHLKSTHLKVEMKKCNEI